MPLIQPSLLIALGALAAAFVALLLLPAVRRRAALVERRRLEAMMPMTAEAIQAGRDALRAEFALTQQRLERDVAEARERADGQVVAAARAQDEARRLTGERDELAARAERLDGEGKSLRASLEAAEAVAAEREVRLAGQETQLKDTRADLQRTSQELEETTYLASSRQIDLVARETELEKLQGELAQTSAKSADLEAKLAEARRAGGPDDNRVAEAGARAEALAAEVFDAEARVERGRTDADRLRRELLAALGERDRATEDLVEARKERMGLELELAALKRQLSGLFPGTVPGGDPATGLKAAAAERDRIETRLATLGRENRELRAALDRAPGAAEARLREEMLRLAAEVTAMVARLEGPDGAVDRALNADGPREEGETSSLADRIRALRERA